MNPFCTLGLAFSFALLLLATPAHASTASDYPDEVTLTSGGFVRGLIVAVEPGHELRIIEAGAKEARAIPWSQIAEIGKGKYLHEEISPPPADESEPPEAGTRISSMVIQSSDKPPPVVHSSWALDLRLRAGISGSGGDIGPSVGASVGIGKWKSNGFYLGGTLFYGAENSGFDQLLRAGAEARYVFAHGTGAARVNEGDSFPVSVTHWAGVSGGFETFHFGDANGGWAAIEYGLDFELGIAIGLVFNFGLGRDNTAASAQTSTSHYWGAIEWRVSFDL